MAELLTDPDVEAFLVSWLPAKLALLGITAKVTATKPSPKVLGPHVIVRRVGGRRAERVVDRARMLIICEGPNPWSTASKVRALINSLPRQGLTNPIVYRVDEISGIAHMPGLQNTVRYSQTFEIYTRSTVLSA